MQQPNVTVTSNLRFTRSGTVWADYVLTGIPYGYRPVEDKNVVRTMHKMLVRALPGESLLMGVCASLDPDAIVARMERGIDLDVHQAWAEECAATIDTLDQFGPGRRIYWLSIPLPNKGLGARIAAATAATATYLGDMLGLPRAAMPAEVVQARERQADLIVASIPSYFAPAVATPAQMVWLHLHSLQRGLSRDTDLPEAGDVDYGAVKNAGAFVAARLDEGAQGDVAAERRWRARVPTLSRVLKIDQPWAPDPPPASYQCLLALADMPAGGVYFPGSEYLTLADDLPGVDVDWAIRLHVRSRDDVTKRNQRALVNLNEQFHQREGALSHGHGIAAAAEDLAAYAEEIESDKSEVEVEASTLFAVGASNAEVAISLQRALAKRFEENDYRLVAPLGYQETLWHAMNPGSPTPPVVREFAQLTTSTHFSAYVPFTRADLGDSSGPLLGLNTTSQRVGVVHHDVATKSASDISGSFGANGNLGSGKSVLLKLIAGNVVDRGGRVVIVDHTTMGEYAVWASTVADAVIIDPSQGKWSMDPMRVFGPVRGAEVAASVLMPLLQIQPDDDFGVTLTTVLSPPYRGQHGMLDGGLYELWLHLRNQECGQEFGAALAKKLGVYVDKSYAASLFAPDLPPLPTASMAIVFRTHMVKLPSQKEIEQQHLFRAMTLEKRVGRAMYALIAYMAREMCFADPSEPALFVLDECHRLTRMEEGIDVVIEFLREGRKEGAYIGLGSQDPDEGMGNDTLRGLIPTRFTMRQTDPILARRGLSFVGLDPEDPDLFKELTEHTSPVSGKDPKTGKEIVEPDRRGEGYMRDAYGNIGRIKVLLPSEPRRRAAVLTTPEDRHARPREPVTA